LKTWNLSEIGQQLEDYLHTEVHKIDGVIGWFCIDFPEEIPISFGLTPLRLMPPPGAIIADSLLDTNFCPYIKANLSHAYAGDYSFLDGLVLANTCDGMRRLFDGWKKFARTPFRHLFDLPRLTTAVSKEFYRRNVLKLIAHMEDFFSLKMEEQKLSEAIRLTNRTRFLLRELYKIYNEDPGSVGYRLVQQCCRASAILPKTRVNKLLEELITKCRPSRALRTPARKCRGDASEAGHNNKRGDSVRPRILLIGNILENSEVAPFIESCEAQISYDDLCTGSRLFHDSIAEDCPPLDALCEHFANKVPCPRMKDVDRRLNHVMNLVKEYKIDGVISYTQKFCDPYLYDIPLIKASLKRALVPFLSIETDYSQRISGQLKTRIKAFLEMIQ